MWHILTECSSETDRFRLLRAYLSILDHLGGSLIILANMALWINPNGHKLLRQVRTLFSSPSLLESLQRLIPYPYK